MKLGRRKFLKAASGLFVPTLLHATVPVQSQTPFFNAPPANSLTPDISWWKLNEGSGTTANDSSGNSNTGTLVNTPTWITNGSGHALNFVNASQQYVSTTNIVNIPHVTLSAWFRVASIPSPQQSIMGMADGFNNGTSDKILAITNIGRVEFYFYAGGPNGVLSSPGAVSINTWHNIAGTYDGNDGYVYLDGSQLGHIGGLGNTDSFDGYTKPNVWIGAPVLASTFDYFNGDVDDVRIYSFALTPTQITMLFNAGPQ